jgi:PST family polysaccharide transporter
MVSINRDDKEKVNEIFTNTIVAKLILFVGGLIILLLLISLVGKINSVMSFMLLAYLGILGNVLFPVWLYQGKEKMSFLSYANVASKILIIASVFMFVNGKSGVGAYLLIFSLGQILNGVITFIRAFKEFGVSFSTIKLSSLRQCYKDGFALFLSNASVSLYTAGNPFILGLFVPANIVGYYTGAEKITKAALGMVAPVTQAIYPRFAKMARESLDVFFIWAKRALILIGGAGLAISVLLYFIAPVVVRLILGPGFDQSVTLIRIMALVPFLISVSNVFGIQIMLPLKKDRDFTKILFVAGIINFGLVFLLAPHIGATASAIALLSAETYVTLSTMFFVNFKIKGKL